MPDIVPQSEFVPPLLVLESSLLRGFRGFDGLPVRIRDVIRSLDGHRLRIRRHRDRLEPADDHRDQEQSTPYFPHASTPARKEVMSYRLSMFLLGISATSPDVAKEASREVRR